MNSADDNIPLFLGDRGEGERFIPVTRFALKERLIAEEAEWNNSGQSILTALDYLATWRHKEYNDRLLKLKEYYLPFSPDRDSQRILEYSAAEIADFQSHLVTDLGEVLDQANYNEIASSDLDLLLFSENTNGLEMSVNLSEYELVLMAYRGKIFQRNIVRNPRWLYLRKQAVVTPIFQRLFLLVKLKTEEARIAEIMAERKCSAKKATKIMQRYRKKLPKNDDGGFIYLKMFKNIAVSDLGMMLPNTDIKMTLMDKWRIGLVAGTGTALAGTGAYASLTTGMTIATSISASILAVFGTVIGGMLIGPLSFLLALAGIGGVALRQVMGFFNTRNKYLLTLADKLYFHSLADNRAVLTLVSDRAEEEDIKEEMLLFYFLSKTPTKRDNFNQLAKEIEHFLLTRFNVIVSYDIYDAFSRLQEDGLVEQRPDGVIKAKTPKEATMMLDDNWQRHFSKYRVT